MILLLNLQFSDFLSNFLPLIIYPPAPLSLHSYQLSTPLLSPSPLLHHLGVEMEGLCDSAAGLPTHTSRLYRFQFSNARIAAPTNWLADLPYDYGCAVMCARTCRPRVLLVCVWILQQSFGQKLLEIYWLAKIFPCVMVTFFSILCVFTWKYLVFSSSTHLILYIHLFWKTTKLDLSQTWLGFNLLWKNVPVKASFAANNGICQVFVQVYNGNRLSWCISRRLCFQLNRI